jgi:hypothetical protein
VCYITGRSSGIRIRRLTQSKHPDLKLYLQLGMKDRLTPQPKNEREAWLHVSAVIAQIKSLCIDMKIYGFDAFVQKYNEGVC